MAKANYCHNALQAQNAFFRNKHEGASLDIKHISAPTNKRKLPRMGLLSYKIDYSFSSGCGSSSTKKSHQS